MNRRRFLSGLAGILAAGTAPAFVSYGSLMVPRRVLSNEWRMQPWSVDIVPAPVNAELFPYQVRYLRGHDMPTVNWEDLSSDQPGPNLVGLMVRGIQELDEWKRATGARPVIFAPPGWPDFDPQQIRRRFG